MPRKKKSKQYFTLDTEEAIIAYNKSTSQRERNDLYKTRIQYPFEKLAENILNTFKFSYFDVSKEDVQMEVISNLIEKIHMFQEGKGKAFSYFSIVAKNYLQSYRYSAAHPSANTAVPTAPCSPPPATLQPSCGTRRHRCNPQLHARGAAPAPPTPSPPALQ